MSKVEILQPPTTKVSKKEDKIGFCPFRAKLIASYPLSQTNYKNVPLSKLDFLKIELSLIVTF